MKPLKNLLTILLILLPFSAHAWGVVVSSGGVAAPAGGYDYEESFDADGYDLADWTESGTVNENYTTDILRGTQSCNLLASSCISRPVTANGTYWTHFLWKYTSDTTTSRYIFRFYNDATELLRAQITADEYLLLRNGTTSVTDATTPLSLNTTYHVWVRYTKGTGADGISTLYIGTSNVRPAALISITNGNATADANKAQYCSGEVGTIDYVLIDTGEIGNVAE